MGSAYDDDDLDGYLYPGELLELPGKLLAENVRHKQQQRQAHALPRLLVSAPKKLSSWEYGRWYEGNYAKREEVLKLMEESQRHRSEQKSTGSSRHDGCRRCSCATKQFPQWNLPTCYSGGQPQRKLSSSSTAGSAGEWSRMSSAGEPGTPLAFSASSSSSRSARCTCSCHGQKRSKPARNGSRSMPAASHNPHLSCMKTWLKGTSPAEAQEALDILNDKLGEKAERYHSNFFHGPGTQPQQQYGTLSSPMKQYIREQRTLAWKQHQLKPHQNVDELSHPRRTGTFLPPVPSYNEYLLGPKAPPNAIKSWYERKGSATLASFDPIARPAPQQGDPIPRQGKKFSGLHHGQPQSWVAEPSNVKSHFLVAEADHLRPTDYSIHPAWGLEKIAE